MWDELEFYKLNGYRAKNKTQKNALHAAAIAFLDREYPHYFSTEMLMIKTPFGSYIWHFIVEMKQELTWNFPEFQQGYQYGLGPGPLDRDHNPYQERARKRSWDCGYILALYEKTL